jgi:hypothetical protein
MFDYYKIWFYLRYPGVYQQFLFEVQGNIIMLLIIYTGVPQITIKSSTVNRLLMKSETLVLYIHLRQAHQREAFTTGDVLIMQSLIQRINSRWNSPGTSSMMNICASNSLYVKLRQVLIIAGI